MLVTTLAPHVDGDLHVAARLHPGDALPDGLQRHDLLTTERVGGARPCRCGPTFTE